MSHTFLTSDGCHFGAHECTRKLDGNGYPSLVRVVKPTLGSVWSFFAVGPVMLVVNFFTS
jgi:hypothetical protein